jgi:hypothetical protein
MIRPVPAQARGGTGLVGVPRPRAQRGVHDHRDRQRECGESGEDQRVGGGRGGVTGDLHNDRHARHGRAEQRRPAHRPVPGLVRPRAATNETEPDGRHHRDDDDPEVHELHQPEHHRISEVLRTRLPHRDRSDERQTGDVAIVVQDRRATASGRRAVIVSLMDVLTTERPLRSPQFEAFQERLVSRKQAAWRTPVSANGSM